MTAGLTSAKEELSGVTLKVRHFDEEDCGIYYCVLELNQSVRRAAKLGA